MVMWRKLMSRRRKEDRRRVYRISLRRRRPCRRGGHCLLHRVDINDIRSPALRIDISQSARDSDELPRMKRGRQPVPNLLQAWVFC